MVNFIYLLSFFCLRFIYFERDREREVRGRGRGRKKIWSRLLTECRALHRVWSQDPEIMTRARIKTWKLNCLTHPCAPIYWAFKKKNCLSVKFYCWLDYVSHILSKVYSKIVHVLFLLLKIWMKLTFHCLNLKRTYFYNIFQHFPSLCAGKCCHILWDLKKEWN